MPTFAGTFRRRPQRAALSVTNRLLSNLGYLLAASALCASVTAESLPGNGTASSPTSSGAQTTETVRSTTSQPSAQQQQPLKKVGEARLKVMLWQIYDARLYTPSGDYQPGARPLKLEIEYLRDIKSKSLAERTLKEWEAMGREHPRQAVWAASLQELWPDIQTHDVLSLELDEAQVATFRRNGEFLGRIEDPEFGQQFVDIWLSEDSTQPELRLTLLGENG